MPYVDHNDDRIIKLQGRFAFSRAFACLAIIISGTSGEISTAQMNKDEPAQNRTDTQSRKFVNKIPYDVFFDKPLQLVANNTAPVAKPTSRNEKSEATVVAPNAATKSSTDSEFAWHLFLPMDELQSEVKSLRNRLTSALANQGQFRQNIKTIANDSTELAALAAIVQNHDESINWKDKSHYVREFSTQISHAATGLTKEEFEKTKSAFQRLITVLDGSIPADAGDVPEIRPFHEAASRKLLMKRIEKAKDWLKQDVNSESKFKSKLDQIRHEASILSALANVIANKGYGDAESEDYQGYARQLIDGAKEASEASGDGTYGKFKQAIDKINKSCTDCHGTYGNS
jgi:hypothetical protein